MNTFIQVLLSLILIAVIVVIALFVSAVWRFSSDRKKMIKKAESMIPELIKKACKKDLHAAATCFVDNTIQLLGFSEAKKTILKQKEQSPKIIAKMLADALLCANNYC